MVEHRSATDLEWGDLAVVLAVCRAGSLVGAARLLRCSHTTVYRRINTIEERARVRFFERLPTGYVMTDAGEVAMRCAERIEAELLALSREVLGRDTRLQGNVVITAPNGMVSDLLPSILASFRREHPDVVFELIEGIAAFDLTRREADIAIRATRKPPDESLGRRIGDFRFAAYASVDYPFESRARALADHPFVVLRGTVDWLVPHVWKTVSRANESVVLRTNSIAAATQAARAGMGVVLLPCYCGDPIPDLRRVSPPLEYLTLELWILTHPALRHTARVRVAMSHLTDALLERSCLFDGTSVPG